jgi:hypothetical protein
MATNVNVYIPNVGEKEILKAFLLQKAMILGVYKTQINPDGSMTFNTLDELPTGGGRGYTRKELTNDILLTALAADKYFVKTNSSGRAEAAYNNDVLTWTFTAADVADGNTYYGIFAFCYVMPFDGGVTEIKVGDTVTGHTSGATGVVTGVSLQSGTWGGGDAAGEIDIKTKSGTFQNDEELWVSGAKVAVANTGITADAHKRLLAVWAFPSGIAITKVGQTLTWDHKIALASGT